MQGSLKKNLKFFSINRPFHFIFILYQLSFTSFTHALLKLGLNFNKVFKNKLSLSCSTFKSTVNQLYSTQLFIHLILYHYFFHSLVYSSRLYFTLVQKVKSKVHLRNTSSSPDMSTCQVRVLRSQVPGKGLKSDSSPRPGLEYVLHLWSSVIENLSVCQAVILVRCGQVTSDNSCSCQ